MARVALLLSTQQAMMVIILGLLLCETGDVRGRRWK